MRARSRLLYLGFALATILAGLAIRFAALGLPQVLVKYGASALWAVMIYWLFALLVPRRSPRWLAVAAGLTATAVELFKLVHTPALDAFRLTLPGILLLGRFFSLCDILVYWLAILATALVDRSLLKPAPLPFPGDPA